MSRRLAILGGTFDPPHVGHLIVATEVAHVGGFDVVVLMVANDPWQKRDDRVVTPAVTRLEMVRAAVDGHPRLAAGDAEIRRGGPTYSIDTVESLLVEEPDLDVALVLGADAVAGLPTWHRADDLRERARIVAVARPGHDLVVPDGWDVTVVDVPAVEVSSTDVRRRCADGAPIDFLVTDAVRSVIVERGLYGVPRWARP